MVSLTDEVSLKSSEFNTTIVLFTTIKLDVWDEEADEACDPDAFADALWLKF